MGPQEEEMQREVDDEWELLEAPSPEIARGAVVPSSNLAAVEDDFFLVDGPGDASCESDAGQDSPRKDASVSPVPVRGQDPVPPCPAENKDSGIDLGEASDGSSTTAGEEPCYRCRSCKLSVFKGQDILSANYHAQTSPGYLLSIAHNIEISSEKQTAVYTTGRYTIQEVACKQCGTVLGVTYSGAADTRNQYKVGKFLVGRDRLILPAGVVHPMDSPRV